MNKIKTILADKCMRIYLLSDLVVVGVLLYLFNIYEYGVLKICRYTILIVGLFVIAWIDSKRRIVKNKHLLILFIIRFILLILELIRYPLLGISIISSAFAGMLIGFVVFGICYFVSRGGMGAGDVKLIAVLGFYLGNTVVVSVIIITVIVAAICCTIRLMMKKATLKSEIPFGPFVLVGCIIAMMLGV